MARRRVRPAKQPQKRKLAGFTSLPGLVLIPDPTFCTAFSEARLYIFASKAAQPSTIIFENVKTFADYVVHRDEPIGPTTGQYNRELLRGCILF